MKKGGLAHLARALDWQSKGGRFDPDILHKVKHRTKIVLCFFVPNSDEVGYWSVLKDFKKVFDLFGMTFVYNEFRLVLKLVFFFFFDGAEVLNREPRIGNGASSINNQNPDSRIPAIVP